MQEDTWRISKDDALMQPLTELEDFVLFSSLFRTSLHCLSFESVLRIMQVNRKDIQCPWSKLGLSTKVKLDGFPKSNI